MRGRGLSGEYRAGGMVGGGDVTCSNDMRGWWPRRSNRRGERRRMRRAEKKIWEEISQDFGVLRQVLVNEMDGRSLLEAGHRSRAVGRSSTVVAI